MTDAGIDLSSYNTTESAEDINDLRLRLKLDSLNLVGISYSGGLMLTVAKRHPEAVRTIVLNSPLPNFVSYENRALTNINEALEQVFSNCKADSSQKYGNLRKSFHVYFSNLSEKPKAFVIKYLEKGSVDSLSIGYGKSELLSVIVDRLNTRQVKDVPRVMYDLVSGKHVQYIRELFDGIFNGNSALSLGMRYSIYCSGQIAFADLAKMKEEEQLYPWLKGYRFNNVDKSLCDCWQVTSEPLSVQKAPTLTVPLLLSAGDIDPWTPPYYNMLMKKTMPNAQVLTFHDRGHGSGFTIDGINYLDMFMANPLKKLVSSSDDLTIK